MVTEIPDDEDFIPGTINIYSTQVKQLGNESVTENLALKTDGHIILVPQPTDSVNDPLNWGVYKKLWNFILVAFITGFTAATSNDAGSTQDSLNEKYGISYDAMNTGAGVLFIAIGTGTYLLAPCANLYGRKISYFICIFLGLLGAIWFALAKSTSDSIWSQLFVGASESCAEAQAQLSISDLYFQHQLGASLTVYMLATSVGTYLGPLIAGFIVANCGFRWVGWIAVFISAGLLIVIVFGMDETYFDRSLYRGVINAVRTTESRLESMRSAQAEKKITRDETIEPKNDSEVSVHEDTKGADEPKKSYWKLVQMITPSTNLRGTGFLQYVNQLKLLLRVLLYPPVIFSGLVWGMQDILLTFYLTVEDDQYYYPPYNKDDTGVALMNIPCLIGSVIGCVYAGVVNDYFVIWLAKRRDGMQEAEYRLWFIFLPAVIAPVGLILFAVGTDQVWPWGWTYLGLGFIGFGFGCSGDTAMAYLMDAYPEMVIEMMVGVSLINNYLSCVFTFACSPWLDSMGITKTFIILAVLEFVIMMCGIPMIYYGKSIRKWTKPSYVSYCEYRDGL